MGKWIETFPNENGLVTEFSPSTISSYAVDRSGKPLVDQFGKPIVIGNKMNVTYRNLAQSAGVDFQGGGGIMVVIKDPRTIVLIFSGAGAHQLTKAQP